MMRRNLMRCTWMHQAARGLTALALGALLAACSSSPSKPQPSALPAVSRRITESGSTCAVAPAKETWFAPALRSSGSVSRTTA